MKQKDDIVPPSKESLLLTEEQKVKALRDQCRASQKETSVLWDKLDAEENYDETLVKAAKKLKIKKEKLDTTFRENKGELVKKFRTAKGDGSVASLGFITGMCASLGSLMAYVGMTQVGAGPLIVFGSLFGGLSIFSGVIAKREFNKKSAAKTSITSQVTEHQKRLADMSAKPA